MDATMHLEGSSRGHMDITMLWILHLHEVSEGERTRPYGKSVQGLGDATTRTRTWSCFLVSKDLGMLRLGDATTRGCYNLGIYD
eukprot:1143644-Pelagomonas_calceolata.AAC.8